MKSLHQQQRQQVFDVIALAVVHLMIVGVSGLRFSSISGRLLLQCNPPSPLFATLLCSSCRRSSHSADSTALFLAKQLSLEFSSDKNGKRQVPLPETFEYTLREEGGQEEEELNADPLRWERLYQQGSAQSQSSRIMSASKTQTTASFASNIVSQVRVVSFDLDNTLWDTMATINAANDALAEFLDQHNIVQPDGQRVETIMGRFFQDNQARYCPELLQRQPDSGSSSHTKAAPVLLTLLRKDVVQHILQEHNGYAMESAMEMADRAFSVWTNARHEAIDASLANNVPDTLKTIIQDLKQHQPAASSGRNSKNSSQERHRHQQVVVGAITDGNSNPRKVRQLAPFFDFVINAEQVGVAKPHRQIYLQAVRHVLKHHPHVFSSSSTSNTQKKNEESVDPENDVSLSDEDIEKLIGGWWIHVGDDFVKDVVAAKTLNMRTIWSRELVLQHDKMNGTTPDKEADQQSPKQPPPTATLRPPPPLLKPREDESPSSIIQPKDGIRPSKFAMQVGSKDYLATCLQEEFADAIVDRFVDVRTVLLDWHLQGIQQQQQRNQNDMMNVNDAPTPPMKPQTKNDQSVSAPQACIVGVETTSDTSTKFCIFCGEKLPLIANFCSACGQKQQ
jgi:FMN phosphatase YigB (HAD superfamily)